MPNPLLINLARGGVNPGVIAGTEVADEQHSDSHSTTKKGAIIGIIIGSILLLILIVWAVVSAKRNSKKATRSMKIAEVGGTSEEVRPLAKEGYPMAVGGKGHPYSQAPTILQPGVSYQPPTYLYPAQGGYSQAPQGQELGQQGTDFYRNQ